MQPGSALVAVLFLAIFTEWLTERFFGNRVHGLAMVYLSAGVGVTLCLLFQVDGLSLVGLPQPLGAPWTGQVVTGVIVGGGASAVHKFFGADRSGEAGERYS